MPYIITTTTPARDRILGKQWHHVDHTAVATHFEARETAAQIIEQNVGGDPDWESVYTDAQNCSEQGESFGPLPDGTVITVRPASWMDLKIHTDLPGDPHGLLSDSAIIAAFNGAQA